jgi:hypothetical protein
MRGTMRLVRYNRGLAHETTNHLRRGYDFHGIFYCRSLEIADARRILTAKTDKVRKEEIRVVEGC